MNMTSVCGVCSGAGWVCRVDDYVFTAHLLSRLSTFALRAYREPGSDMATSHLLIPPLLRAAFHACGLRNIAYIQDVYSATEQACAGSRLVTRQAVPHIHPLPYGGFFSYNLASSCPIIPLYSWDGSVTSFLPSFKQDYGAVTDACGYGTGRGQGGPYRLGLQ